MYRFSLLKKLQNNKKINKKLGKNLNKTETTNHGSQKI
jgi:hypothetical protein